MIDSSDGPPPTSTSGTADAAPAGSSAKVEQNEYQPQMAVVGATNEAGVDPRASTSRLQIAGEEEPAAVHATTTTAVDRPTTTISHVPTSLPNSRVNQAQFVDPLQAGANSGNNGEQPHAQPQSQPQQVAPLQTANDDSKRAPSSSEEMAIIELLLLSGSRKRFEFRPTAKVSEVLAFVYKEWPEGWEEKKPAQLSQLRLLHRGQFLSEASTLASNKIESNQVTVVHLTIRSADAASSGSVLSNGKATKGATRAATTAGQQDTHGGGCCSNCCIS